MKDAPSTAKPTAGRPAELTAPVRITHPFHPLFGQELDLVVRRAHFGENRVFYRDREGHLASLPAQWTSLVPEDPCAIARALAASAPDVVGLSMQFQHRAAEFLSLARHLRFEGFSGHLTCGGRFPSAAWRELLERDDGVDSIVLFDGEETFVELLAALASNRPLAGVRGLAIREPAGAPSQTPGRPLPDLDALPFAHRYRAPARHFGVPFLPIMGARGCWGDCTFCSVTSHYREAHRHGGGKALRMRAPERVAEEIAQLWHQVGPSIFCSLLALLSVY